MALWRLTTRRRPREQEPREPAPYQTAVERFVRRHPQVALMVTEIAVLVGTLAALVALVEHWSDPRSPIFALPVGVSVAAIAVVVLVRLWRDGFAAPIPVLLLSWLPPVMAIVAALEPSSAGGWGVVAGYSFLVIYLPGCGALLGLGPRVKRQEEDLRRARLSSDRRATLRAARRTARRRRRNRPTPPS